MTTPLTPQLDGVGPCDWPILYGDCDVSALEKLDDTMKAAVERSAIEYLWAWTGRVFGTCPAVVRPCRASCAQVPVFWRSPFTRYGVGEGRDVPLVPISETHPVDGEYLVDGAEVVSDSPGAYEVSETPGQTWAAWTDYVCGCSGSVCGCEDESPRSLRLPGRVVSIESVVVGGKVLEPWRYRVDNHALLVRTDGGTWPTCQDLVAHPSQPNTFQVSYTRGAAVPYGGQLAAGVLAVEMAKKLCNDSSCALPSRVQNITRQGVSMVMLDNFEDLSQGRTGLWLVDSWLVSMTKPRRPMGVFSVDVPRQRDRVTTYEPPLPFSPTSPMPATSPSDVQ